jgi:hypothetical protein
MILEAAEAEAAAVAPQAMKAGDLPGIVTGTAVAAGSRDAAEVGTELEIRLKLQNGGCKSGAFPFNDITTPFEIILTA